MYNKLISIISILLCSLITACTSPHYAERTVITRDELLSGSALFGEEAEQWELPYHEILKLDDEMRSFVHQVTAKRYSDNGRAKALLTGMIDHGLLGLEYDARKTYSASDTFHKKTGNCLAFTNLFVALAREAELDVTFQQVDVPPIWMKGGDVIVLNRHINAYIDIEFAYDNVVDFNRDEFRSDYDTRLISDQEAFAQFYSNLGIGFLEDKNYKDAYRYLKKALQLDPKSSSIWVNLGALYSRNQLYKQSEAAYLYALEEDSRNYTAHSNLASLYEHWHDFVNAEYHQKRIRYYREINPYYHYWLSQQAFLNGDPYSALQHLEKSIRLKSDESVFYFTKGLMFYDLKDFTSADKQFSLAMKYASQESIKERYRSKLEKIKH
ncbi:tetratricopeptide repeat protein [Porticoccaceae bacterium LTM1]|nr:tetratricopeptide repeat protein [Porticoccaceae bacterium LTM1]